MSQSRFVSVMTPPPGGKFFYEVNGERVEAATWPEMQPKAAALMAKNGIEGPVEWAVASYMCPSMPDWYCRGVAGRTVVRDREAVVAAEQYFRKPLVPFDTVSDRLRACSECQKHSREGACITCSGRLAWILARFGGRRFRPKVLEDELSGVCTCARTFEAVIASVSYGEDEECWEGAPDTCWRKKR